MNLKLYQIDAFAKKPFEGNPAAVVPLEQWLPDDTLQQIAAENNLAETAYYIATDRGFAIRWFTPGSEVKLCGHATLASAYVLFNEFNYANDKIVFDSMSGPLSVTRNDDLLTLDFPNQMPSTCEVPQDLTLGLGIEPTECYANEDYLAVYANEGTLASIEPKAEPLAQLDKRGVIATAPSAQFDFVSRFFAPKVAILEDPVTGSSFTHLIPYWAERLGKKKMIAKQISSRGGIVHCELAGDRVLISGNAFKYMEGEFTVTG
ncbi:MAG: PhzF family phenazine biosynthesis isomerase [Pseudomonadales bacterium]|nr:PhzF family phenazine biosynthesis isomerase [Pseudomonadales bacterium]